MERNENKQRVVVKIGSRLLSDENDGLNYEFLDRIVSELADLTERGHEIVLVSSGAIRLGARKLNLSWSHLDIVGKQAAAAVGQGMLIATYGKLFGSRDVTVAQVLLTPDIISLRKKYLNARNTVRHLLSIHTVPVVNENDTVASDEIKFGDNDTLAAITAILTDADLLVLLSDVDGMYDGNPQLTPSVKRISEIKELNEEIAGLAGGPATPGSFGGMTTKLLAAKASMESGIPMVIAHGLTENVVTRILAGESLGTRFTPKISSLSARKKWLAFGCQTEGVIKVNSGAKKAIVSDGKSLLPSGIVGVENSFDQGACVEIQGPDDTVFAKGLTNYTSLELEQIQGHRSVEIKKILHYKIADEAIHRDDLVLLPLPKI